MAHLKRTSFTSMTVTNNRSNDSANWRQLAAEVEEHRSSEAFGAKLNRRNRRERKLDDRRNPYR